MTATGLTVTGLAVEHDAVAQRWTLRWGGTRLDLRLRATALACEWFGPDFAGAAPALWSGWREHELLLNARLPAMVEVGARPTCLAWRLEGWDRDAGSLVIRLLAEEAALTCEVRHVVDAATGMVLRETVLRHVGTAGVVEVSGALSLWLAVRGEVSGARVLTGAWGAEAQERRVAAGHAALVLDSRSGKTGFEFQPWLALEGAQGAHVAEVMWSGNWRLEARLRPGVATLSGGVNDWGFAHGLGPGEALALPAVLLGFDPAGVEAVTRRLHDWRRAGRRTRAVPVQFNTWYALDEDVDEARVMALVPRAAGLGCEVFVLDAGWYTTKAWSPLSNWHARAGDWVVDPQRFPAGLGRVADAVRAAGMGFGIWCEPEAVGACSALRAAHPDWLHWNDGHAPAVDARAVLHLGVPAAWNHAFAVLAGLVRETGAAWLKWDFNADLGAGGWARGVEAELARQDPLVAHYRGLYRLQAALRAAFPDLVLEMCASGGGRMDGAILAEADTNWISDQPQAVAKLAIHFGMQRAHPAVCCNDWMVDWPARSYSGVEGVDLRGDLAFRLRVAMLGSFGISAPLGVWSAGQMAVAREHVALYRAVVRGLVAEGDQYLLTEAPPLDGRGEWAAVWYAAKDGSRGVLFAFRLEGAAERRFALPGLRAGAWRVRGDGVVAAEGGVEVTLAGRFASVLAVVEVDAPA